MSELSKHIISLNPKLFKQEVMIVPEISKTILSTPAPSIIPVSGLLHRYDFSNTYEDEGTTYVKSSFGGTDIPVVSGTGTDMILDMSVLNDDRFDKGSYVGNAFGLPEYYDYPYNNIYYDDTSEDTRYHWKVTDFHYRWLEAQSVGLTNVFFGKLSYSDEALQGVDKIFIYENELTGGNLSKIRNHCSINDFQNQNNYYYTSEWIIRDMLQFVIEGDSFSFTLEGNNQIVYWGDGNLDTVNSRTIYSHNFANDDKHLISVTDGLVRFDIGEKSLKGNIAYWADYLSRWTNIAYFSIDSNQLQGVLSNWDLSGWTNIAYFIIYSNQLQGDLSNWDLSGWPNIIYFYIFSNHFTNAPYTESIKIANYRISSNEINDSDNIDTILAGLESFFSTNVPIQNAAFSLSGNTAPSAAGLTSKSNIETYFTNAGYTATILVD